MCESISSIKINEKANLEHWQPQLTKVEAAFKFAEVIFATGKSKTVWVGFKD